MRSQLFKNLILWLVIFVAIIALYQLIHTPRGNLLEIPYSEFLASLERGKINDVEFNGEAIKGTYLRRSDDQLQQGFKTVGPASDELINKLGEKGVTFKFSGKQEGSFIHLLFNWAPLILLIVIMVLFMRQLQAGGSDYRETYACARRRTASRIRLAVWRPHRIRSGHRTTVTKRCLRRCRRARGM